MVLHYVMLYFISKCIIRFGQLTESSYVMVYVCAISYSYSTRCATLSHGL